LAVTSDAEALAAGTKQPNGQLPGTIVQSVSLAQSSREATNATNSCLAAQLARERARASGGSSRNGGDLSSSSHVLDATGAADERVEGTAG
jgi:hypothetical protein